MATTKQAKRRKELEAKYYFMTPEQRSRIVNFIINNE